MQLSTPRSFPLLQPPLGGAVSCWEGLNIRIAAVVGGLHFGSLDGGGPGGLQLWGSVGVRSQRSTQQMREALAVAPGHIAAAPAPPLGPEARGSAGDAELLQLLQHDMVRHVEAAAGAGAAPSAAAAGIAALAAPAAAAAVGAQAAGGPGQEEARLQRLAAAGAASAAWADSCSRSAVVDSPSEMCASPQPAGWAQQQARPGPPGGPGSTSGWAGLDAATQAALREAATAAAALVPAAAAQDFMHPSRWAEARCQRGGEPQHQLPGSGSTSTQDGGAGSVHSFLLPGRRFSSEDESEAGSGPPCLLPAALMLRPGAAAAAVAAAGRPREALLQLQPEPGGHTAGQHAAAAGPAAAQAGVPHPGGLAEPAAEVAGPAGGDAALPLFGRGDHQAGAARPLSATQRLRLALRAGQLLALFLPFLLLGSLMLLLASRVDSAAARRRRQQQQQELQQQQQGLHGPQQEEQQEDAEVAGPPAAGAGAQLAAPAVAGAAPQGAASRLRTCAFKLLLGACRRRWAGRAAKTLPACRQTPLPAA